jgi:hypothetical protein
LVNWKTWEGGDKTNKKIKIGTSIILITIAFIAVFFTGYQTRTSLLINSATGLGIGVNNENGKLELPNAVIHSTIYVYEYGKLIGVYHHPGVVTQLGMNYTLGKITGYSTSYNMTQYTYNCTYVSIGNQGSLSATSTVLPGEWNRTTGTIHDATYNSFNVTAVFAGTSGTQTADCLGLNFGSATIGTAYTLWGYDTFTEVTGIDSTFTITIEIKVSLS